MRAELAGLGRELAAETGAHLAAAGFFFESDPERAWAHSVAARRRASRLGVVRETAGLAAYRAGLYAEALSELRTARRMTGSNVHLPVMADSERGLGRPERALEVAHSPEARTLDRNAKIELLIVESGARNDLGEHDAAVVVLQIPELDTPSNSPTLARLRFAYSEALNRAAREREAATWRERAMDSDRDGTASLYADPDDEEIVDLLEGDEDDDGEDEAASGEREVADRADGSDGAERADGDRAEADVADTGSDTDYDERDDDDQDVDVVDAPVAGDNQTDDDQVDDRESDDDRDSEAADAALAGDESSPLAAHRLPPTVEFRPKGDI